MKRKKVNLILERHKVNPLILIPSALMSLVGLYTIFYLPRHIIFDILGIIIIFIAGALFGIQIAKTRKIEKKIPLTIETDK